MRPTKLTKPKDAELAERRATVLNMRKSGATIKQIADKLGVSDGTVHNDLVVTLKQLQERTIELGDSLRELELARLDSALIAIAKQVQDGHLGAVDRMVKIVELRAKLLGLTLQRTDITSGGEPLKAYIGISPDTWDE